MTEAAAPKKKAAGGLNSMLLADLKAMASGMGIAGSGAMKKAQLVDAIKTAQSSRPTQKPAEKTEPKTDAGASTAPKVTTRTRGSKAAAAPQTEAAAAKPEQDAAQDAGQDAGQNAGQVESKPRQRQRRAKADAVEAKQAEPQHAEPTDKGEQADKGDQGDQDGQRQQRRQQQNQNQQSQSQGQGQQGQHQGRQQNQGQQNQPQGQGQGQGQQGQHPGDDEDGGSRRNRRRRGRDRDRPVGAARGDMDVEIREDDVLVPAAGILDVLDNYAFVRTSGYLPGADDVYVSLSMVRKLGLRRGDAIVGQVRQPREGERKEKFNPMVRIDSVNGTDPANAAGRVDFSKLTPLYANERLRMETNAENLIGRVIDIAAPIGKGQRGLIVSPAKAGKTMVMQSIANSITANNPECHLMVVLVDERPEEVTDFQRSVKGEVIASTFDRQPADHTIVAELAIERAKRLVELGHDVVVLLDGITRLGRAYNLSAPASGRILSGGVDSAALYPPKKFFGAARNIENGGSLTILATALIESGSKMDEVIFEEFKGTGNMELRLRRDFAEKRLFPAIDVVQSGTRREELLLSKEELAIVWKLRKVLAGLDGQQALELLLERMRKTHSNVEFLMQIAKTTPDA
ncbi:transcription termination factor Rho [Nocardioides nematodiphilus]|uniref:transcription termination factor Rho n=1 Tax=Nocardioides nematodiphilus TaxID=2849669 RepID=UPI001CDA2183|nr:transcription termination factor Rho [Nocardioides nematodiphilus]MCA1982362.1 transcription termination factor Rho [Nocardioides nematodiphilus]